MAQSGLHIPAEPGSRLAIVNEVFVDIGDEQSIAQSLSTFSGHLMNIIRILREVKPNTLVLLDEIGAGTDPSEGAALGKAILLELYEHGCRTIATTHYGELKVFGQHTAGFLNASVEFDLETLRPTYRVITGLPGSSNALAISQRLGLPKAVVSRAKGLMGESPQALEQALKQAEGVRRALDRERSAAARLRQEMEVTARQLQQTQQELDTKRNTLLARARQQAQDFVQQSRIEANALLDELKAAVREARNTPAPAPLPLPLPRHAATLKTHAQQVLGEIMTRAAELPSPAVSTPKASEQPALQHVVAGQSVLVRSLGHKGVVLENGDKDDEVEVQVGIMRVRVPVTDLEARGPVKLDIIPLPDARYAPGVEKELLLLGKRAEEACEELQGYLYDALEQGLAQVRIVHGFGTGALRQVVLDVLRNHSAVRTYRAGQAGEGGGGVTIAELSVEKKA
jgi:DNA mismatch repair protein MutS2